MRQRFAAIDGLTSARCRGRIIKGLRQAESNNPVFMLDEIDKLGSDFRGDPASALLEVLDPEQNNSFTDNYIEVPFDLSKVMFITTANQLHTIPPPLRDRMELLELPGYTANEKLMIAKQYLILRQLEAHGISEEQLSVDDDAIHHVINDYTREAGVRNVERELGTICRKSRSQNRRRENGANQRHHVRCSRLPWPPGSSIRKSLEREEEVGVVTGLSWTAAGGEILFVEAALLEDTRPQGDGKVDFNRTAW